MSSQIKNDFWLKQQSFLTPDRTFIKTISKEFSYSEVFELSQRTAEYFHLNGIKKGSHVSVISQNNSEFIIVVNALWFLGAIPILINTRLQKNEIDKLLFHSDSNFLININNKIDTHDFNSVIIFSLEIIKSQKSLEDFEKFDLENIAAMIYSSGSTGEPKLVQLTFNNFYNSFLSSNEFIEHSQDDIWLASLPFYHVGGFSIITRSLLGGCIIAIPNSLKENDLLEAFDKFNPSLISLVPTMLQKILEKKIKPWKNLRIVFIGGGPATEKTIMESLEIKFPITIVYGSTETSSMVAFCSKENLKQNGFSVGKPFRNVKFKIVDENRKELKNNKIGEIIIQSDSVAKSYYKNDKAKDLQNRIYYTNDLGKIDDKGNLHIVGRKDDIIISGGENISIKQVENLVSQNFHLKNITAIGIKDEKWGQSFVLVIESDGDEKLQNEIREYLKTKLASYKLPKKILFTDKFPKTELGKIKKRELANQFKLNVL